MSESTLREANYRGQELIDRLAELHIVVCGAGALGSNFIHEIVRQGARTIKVIDDDRVEEHNISTQMYGYSHVGKLKAHSIQSLIWVLFELQIRCYSKELTERNVFQQLHRQYADLVIDTFDNVRSRQLVDDFCQDQGIPCLHLGMAEDGNYGHVMWGRCQYTESPSRFNDPCEIPATRNLISIVVAMGCESVMRWLDTQVQQNMEFTLRDMRITVR